jgi:hypothetical protein
LVKRRFLLATRRPACFALWQIQQDVVLSEIHLFKMYCYYTFAKSVDKALADFVPERKRLVEMGQDPDYESANKSEYGWTEPTRWATPKDRPAFSTPLSTGF